MNIELIAVDLDGTTLRTDKSVSERTAKALAEAAARGIRVVPATGRVAKMLPRAVREIPGVRYAVTSNGASVLDLDERSALYENPMPRGASERIVRFFLAKGYLTEAYCGGLSYANAEAFPKLLERKLPEEIYDYIRESQIFVEDLPAFLRERGFRLEKVNIPFVPAGEMEPLRRAVLAMKGYAVTRSGRVNLEVGDASANKGDGLRHLCERLGVGPDRVMAIGDQENDVEMLRFAGLGVAMGNAARAALDAADAVTASNDGDGVALAVERYALDGAPARTARL